MDKPPYDALWLGDLGRYETHDEVHARQKSTAQLSYGQTLLRTLDEATRVVDRACELLEQHAGKPPLRPRERLAALLHIHGLTARCRQMGLYAEDAGFYDLPGAEHSATNRALSDDERLAIASKLQRAVDAAGTKGKP